MGISHRCNDRLDKLYLVYEGSPWGLPFLSAKSAVLF